MNNILELLMNHDNFLLHILTFIRNNNFIWWYFCYTIGIILTTFALNLITNCVKDNKISTMAFAFGIKLAIFMFLKILQDTLTL